MIVEESLPTLRRRFSPVDHILGHTRLPDFDAELEQLSMDPRRAPQRIGDAHPADKLAYLRRYSWSATTTSRLPAPIRSETRAMPTDDCIRLDDRQRITSLGKQSIKTNEYQPIKNTKGLPSRRACRLFRERAREACRASTSVGELRRVDNAKPDRKSHKPRRPNRRALMLVDLSWNSEISSHGFSPQLQIFLRPIVVKLRFRPRPRAI